MSRAPRDLRMLRVIANEATGIWDLSENPPDRRVNYEAIGQACVEGGCFVTCAAGESAKAADMYHPDLAEFLMADPPEYSRLWSIVEDVRALHDRGIPCVTTGQDWPTFMWQSAANVIVYQQALDEFDAILVPDTERHVFPHVTRTPAYHWMRPSEMCRYMHDRPYPDGPRDLIAIVRFHEQHVGCSWGGSIQNYLVAKPILEAFPELTGWALCAMWDCDIDPYLVHMGIQDRFLPPTPEFRPWEEAAELLSRTKLAIHMEYPSTRSQFLVECAACGVPIVTTRYPDSAALLSVPHQLVNDNAIDEAVHVGMGYLTNDEDWLMESKRLFAVSKRFDIDDNLALLRRIIARFKEEHP